MLPRTALDRIWKSFHDNVELPGVEWEVWVVWDARRSRGALSGKSRISRKGTSYLGHLDSLQAVPKRPVQAVCEGTELARTGSAARVYGVCIYVHFNGLGGGLQGVIFGQG